MLRSLFNRLLWVPPVPPRPIVLVTTLGDDKTRGDSHGYIGIGKMVAQKLDGEYHYIDEDVLTALYPDVAEADEALNLYLQQTGIPDIVFARYDRNWRKMEPRPFVIDTINEDLTRSTGPEKELVSHHITAESFQSEGENFSAAYPDLKTPLIAVMMADHTHLGFAARLVPMISHFDSASIFVCSSRRTWKNAYDSMLSSLEGELATAGAGDRITVSGYEFNEGKMKNAYNPYIGLLGRADHIVVCGDSQSIVSEAIAAGKSVHLFEPLCHYKKLSREGIVSIFNAAAKNEKLETRAIPPINPTENAANAVIAKYHKHKLRENGLLREVMSFLKK